MSVWRLAWLKTTINAVVPQLLRMTPDKRAKRPVSQLTLRLFQMLRKGLTLHPTRFYADKHFPELLSALEKTIVFIAEEDGHYAGWLAMTMLLIHDLVEESRPRFPRTALGDAAWIQWASKQLITRIEPDLSPSPS